MYLELEWFVVCIHFGDVQRLGLGFKAFGAHRPLDKGSVKISKMACQ